MKGSIVLEEFRLTVTARRGQEPAAYEEALRILRSPAFRRRLAAAVRRACRGAAPLEGVRCRLSR